MLRGKCPSFKCILLDIEGTTTPVSFVYETLFPFAKQNIKKYLVENQTSPETSLLMSQLNEEHQRDTNSPPPWTNPSEIESAVIYLHWLMERDRKSTPLKSLQGKIWEEGYAKGELKGEVFPDVPGALERWHQRGISLAIFSSGSILAQKLLFSHTQHGDLTRFFTAFFDTTTGAKNVSESYSKISEVLQKKSTDILFVSDMVVELDAASSIGMQTLLSVRPGNKPQPQSSHSAIYSFNEIERFEP